MVNVKQVSDNCTMFKRDKETVMVYTEDLKVIALIFDNCEKSNGYPAFYTECTDKEAFDNICYILKGKLVTDGVCENFFEKTLVKDYNIMISPSQKDVMDAIHEKAYSVYKTLT